MGKPLPAAPETGEKRTSAGCTEQTFHGSEFNLTTDRENEWQTNESAGLTGERDTPVEFIPRSPPQAGADRRATEAFDRIFWSTRALLKRNLPSVRPTSPEKRVHPITYESQDG